MSIAPLARNSTVLLATTVLLAGCGRTGPSRPVTSSVAGASVTALAGGGSEAGFSSPAAEGSGLESPQRQQEGGPSVTVATMPFMLNYIPDPADSEQGCAEIHPLQPLPDGVVMLLGTVNLKSDGNYAPGGGGCPSDQPLCTAQIRWRTDSPACSLPVIRLYPEAPAQLTVQVGGMIHFASQTVFDQLRAVLATRAVLLPLPTATADNSVPRFTPVPSLLVIAPTAPSSSAASAQPSPSPSETP